MAIKICLDAGHSGKYNSSPILPGYYESDMVWKLHLLQKKYLEAMGFEVVTTRPTQATVMDVYARGAAAKGCQLIISDHSNACGDPAVDYPVAYRAYDNRSGVDALGLALSRRVGEVMGTRQAGRTASRQTSTGGEYYGVLRGARAMGVPHYMILEHSFHTNLAATKWLSNDKNLEQLAAAECRVIADFYGVKAPASVPTPPDWKAQGLDALHDKGIITNPDYWKGRFDEPITVGEAIGILGKITGK